MPQAGSAEDVPLGLVWIGNLFLPDAEEVLASRQAAADDTWADADQYHKFHVSAGKLQGALAAAESALFNVHMYTSLVERVERIQWT